MQRCKAGADYLISIMVTLRYKKMLALYNNNTKVCVVSYTGIYFKRNGFALRDWSWEIFHNMN